MYKCWNFSKRFILIVATFVSVSATSLAHAGPGDCPGVATTSAINQCYEAWVDKLANEDIYIDPIVDSIVCTDEPSMPAISMRITIELGGQGGDNPFFRITNQHDIPNMGDGTSELAARNPGGDFECTSSEGDPLVFGTSNQHICRAAVLRSVPWRQWRRQCLNN